MSRIAGLPQGPWTYPPVRVGLVGAGPWARAMHARMLAAARKPL